MGRTFGHYRCFRCKRRISNSGLARASHERACKKRRGIWPPEAK